MSRQEEIHTESKSLNFQLGQLTSAFQVPDHYFSDFPEKIIALIHAEAETEQITRQFTPDMPYSVPESYFKTFINQLLARLSGEESDAGLPLTLLDTTGLKRLPYGIPEHYFQDLDKQLLAKIQDNAGKETEFLSPLVAGLRDKPTFEVPAGYFERPKAKILTFTKTAEQSIKWTRWAAAAAIIFIFSLGGWKFLNTSGSIDSKADFQQVLAQIPDADIQEYLNYTLNDYETLALSKKTYTQDPVTQKMFEGISDQEIKEYLEYNVY